MTVLLFGFSTPQHTPAHPIGGCAGPATARVKCAQHTRGVSWGVLAQDFSTPQHTPAPAHFIQHRRGLSVLGERVCWIGSSTVQPQEKPTMSDFQHTPGCAVRPPSGGGRTRTYARARGCADGFLLLVAAVLLVAKVR